MTLQFNVGRMQVQLYEQWTDVFRMFRCNWIDFTFIEVGCEWARNTESAELTVALIGFRLWFMLNLERAAEELAADAR